MRKFKLVTAFLGSLLVCGPASAVPVEISWGESYSVVDTSTFNTATVDLLLTIAFDTDDMIYTPSQGGFGPFVGLQNATATLSYGNGAFSQSYSQRRAYFEEKQAFGLTEVEFESGFSSSAGELYAYNYNTTVPNADIQTVLDNPLQEVDIDFNAPQSFCTASGLSTCERYGFIWSAPLKDYKIDGVSQIVAPTPPVIVNPIPIPTPVPTPSPVPVPASLPLLGMAIGLLGWRARKRS